MANAKGPATTPQRREYAYPRSRSCIVIGGGLAGLSAARYLCKAGWTVTVLEARHRFGGRVLSHRFRKAPHLVCELGGEWIGKDHDAMQKLCSELRLPLELHSYGFTFWNGGLRAPIKWFRPGAWPFKSVSERQFMNFGRRLRGYSARQNRLLDKKDWWTQLRQWGFSESDLLVRDLMDSTDFGESIRMTSAYGAAWKTA